ncbi:MULTISPECIES: DUF4235 domain-containing protein [Micrococcales]|uniref:DUF4235 domain-containing protein n=1 Tax=Micrococcales TaxID=85006 RepID=UPI000565274A|nr:MULTISPECIES: DUF4235 domain-containing protein [Micrococcales]
MSNPVIKIGSTVASLGGVFAANKIMTLGWKKVTGNEPPANNPDPEESLRDVIIWTAISGVVATLIKVGVTRLAAKMEKKEEVETGGQAEV